jgi:putative hydrolase of the HAD superfamily
VTIRAVFFDLDDTLVWLDRAALESKMADVYAAVSARFRLESAEVLMQRHQLASTQFWSADGHGIVGSYSRSRDGATSSRRIWELVLEEFGGTAEDACEAHDRYWRQRFGVIKLFENARSVLQEVRGKASMAVITNGPPDFQMDKLGVHGLDGLFDLFLASGEIGIAKPDPGIFVEALGRLKLSASEVLHVGDSLVYDVAAAKAAGLATGWLNRNALARRADDPVPDFELTSLADLPAIVEKLTI